jgi:PAS domain S-box-containing protein
MFKDGTLDTVARDTDYFQEILDIGGLGLWEYDHAVKRIAWCSRACAMFGWTGSAPPESLAAWSEWIHPEDQPQVGAWMDGVLSADCPVPEARFRMRRDDGDWLWISIRGRVVARGAEGQPLRAAGILAHVDRRQSSDRRRAADSGERPHPALDERTGTWGRSIPARRVRGNTREYERAARAADEGCYARARPASLEAPQAQAEWMAGDGARGVHESRALVAQGKTFRSLQGVQGKMTSTDDSASGCPGSEAVQWTHARLFHDLADQAPALIWMAGPDLGCYYFNQAWLDFTGRTLAEEQGDGWVQGIHPDDLARCLDTYQSAFAGRRAFSMEYRLRRHDGEYRWIIDKGAPSYGSQGEFLSYIGSGLDITELKRAEETRTYALTAALNCGFRCSLPSMKPLMKSATTSLNKSRRHW